ncbi:hypothetical protein HYPSUDRAFT_1047745 [Hypholoma sublateritium FD-334 SS-4]|uniref:ABC transporter domain-containing protein n=1 Tax=Hypholoma sublateritium (strain FD-334 SS-4) TaxID=945553 RepID=A0A0D2NCV6_HYPSF|nr:hypothetical protein HYPSUDRAFT_1047745 [Hypholoma sublateritium FD-334 SS-4]
MLTGSVRQNLDPFNEYDDAHLNDALPAVGLQSNSESYSAFTLDTPIMAGGSNISVGQRQILALAQAIIRNSKMLILDEATSAIDHEIYALILSMLLQQLGKDVTVLIVAHYHYGFR